MKTKIILLFLLLAKVVYADSFIDRCQQYFIRNFISQPQLSLDLNEGQMETRFMGIAFKIIKRKTAPTSFFRKYERVHDYKVIKNILDNNPTSDLKKRIALFSAEVYWEEFGPLILMDLLETNPGIEVQRQMILSITNMYFRYRKYLNTLEKLSKAIFPDSVFKNSDSDEFNMQMLVLKKLLEKNPPPAVQKSIAYSLGRIQHSIGGYFLEMMLKANSVLALTVQEEIARSAGFIESAKGVPALILILKHHSPSQPLQSVIIQSAVNIGVEGLPVLEVMLEQDPPHYEIILEIAYYVGLLSQNNGTLMLSKTLKHNSLSSEEKQNILKAYFTGKSAKNETRRSTDNGNNKEGGNKFDPPPFAPLL